MRVSFTGSMYGMTRWQARQLADWFREHRNRMMIFSHGCCIGADIEAHSLAREICGSALFIAVFPSTAKTRAPIPEDSDHVAEPRPPLERNPDIVNVGHDMLLATPKEMHEVLRSGTWATIRYARKMKIPYKVLWPTRWPADGHDQGRV